MLMAGFGRPAWAEDPEPPDSVMLVLPNGMRVVAAPRSYNKVLSLNLFIEGGAAEDPVGQEGLANLTQRLLIKGAAKMDAEDIAETIESVGGRISASTAADYCELFTVTTAEDLDLALDLLADAMLRPTFPDGEIERERELVISGIRRRRDSQFGYTYLEFLREMYAGHPYGHPIDGEELTVRTLSRDTIAQFHARRCRPERLILAACGDIDPKALAVKAAERFKDFPQSPRLPRMTVNKSMRPQFIQRELRKDCKQAFVVTGFPAVPLSHPDYAPLRLAHAMLGEGMSARLFRRLRDERSLAYEVGSRVDARALSGHLALWIGTSPGSAEEARLSLLSEARNLARDGTPAEFERARNYVLGKMLIARQSNYAKANSLGAFEAMGVGFQFEEKLVQAIEAVDRRQALATLQRYLTTPVSVVLLPEE